MLACVFVRGCIYAWSLELNVRDYMCLHVFGRCGKQKLENTRSETAMVRRCGEKDRGKCSNENM